MFIDRAKIHVQGGDGGNGVTAFRREKFVPRGGPSGGDGGRGGDVVLVADQSLNTLLHLRYNPRHVADRGLHGEGSNRSGREGGDLIVRVPVGTQIFDPDTEELLHDLSYDGARWLAARGGRGGFGNAHFTSSTNRAPRYHQTGSKGEERELQLELKLLADVGLVGFPNAGKSTFISTVSAARPKIADYPFTTLVPNLGVVGYGDGKSFVVADIPGLIEGAHEGQGLGHKFLRHVMRTNLLIHLIDASNIEKDPLAQWKTVNRELELFDSELGEKPQIVVANKIDLPEGRANAKLIAKKLPKEHQPLHTISAATTEGVEGLVQVIGAKLDEIKHQAEASRDAAGL
jgi:GTPase